MKDARTLTVALALALAANVPACGSDDPSGGDADAGDDADGEAGDEAGDVPEEGDAEGDAENGETSTVALEPGQVVEIAAGEDGGFEVELATPGGAEQFGLVLYSALWAMGDEVGYDVQVTGASAKASEGGGGEAKSRDGFDLVPGALPDFPAAARALATGEARLARADPMPTPVLGEHRSYQITDSGVTTIDAECIWVGDELAMWIDRTTPGAGDIPGETLDDIGSRFEGTVLPRERQYFGDGPDINTDGVVNAVFSPIVYDSAVAYFSPCDLFESDALPAGCAYSNEQEMLYMTPPDVIPPPMNSPRAIVTTMAHEFQHLVYFYRKEILNDLSGNENAYLLEGWASLGEDVTGYGLGTFFVAAEGLDHSDDFGAIEIMRNGGGYDRLRDGMLRGASYMWMRYLFDRMGGDSIAGDGTITDEGGITWTRAAVDAPREGRPNIEQSTGVEIDELVFDWYTALLLTGRTDAAGDPLPVEPRFTYLPRVTDPVTTFGRGFDPWGEQFGVTLEGPVTTTPALMDRLIPPTGNELIVVDADGSSAAMSVRVTGDDIAELRLRVARLR